MRRNAQVAMHSFGLWFVIFFKLLLRFKHNFHLLLLSLDHHCHLQNTILPAISSQQHLIFFTFIHHSYHHHITITTSLSLHHHILIISSPSHPIPSSPSHHILLHHIRSSSHHLPSPAPDRVRRWTSTRCLRMSAPSPSTATPRRSPTSSCASPADSSDTKETNVRLKRASRWAAKAQWWLNER